MYYCYKPETGDYCFIHLREEQNILFFVHSYVDSGSNRVWLGGDKGRLFLLINLQAVSLYKDRLELRSPNVQLRNHSMSILFIWAFNIMVLFGYDLVKKSFSNFLLGFMKEKSICTGYPIDENFFWVAKEKGLYRYDETTKTYYSFETDF